MLVRTEPAGGLTSPEALERKSQSQEKDTMKLIKSMLILMIITGAAGAAITAMALA